MMTLGERLKIMSESELLRFGQAAKFVCRDRNPPEPFLIQLREVSSGVATATSEAAVK
jgi:hypothetical protein